MKNQLVRDPYSLEAEQAVLGSILLDPDCLSTATDVLGTENFYLQRHRAIFSMLIRMSEDGKSINPFSAFEELKKDIFYAICQVFNGVVQKGHQAKDEEELKLYLLKLSESVPDDSSLEDNIRIVYEAYCAREEVLLEIIEPLIEVQDPITVCEAAERLRTSEHTWIRDCLMPSFQSWVNSLPNEQITWLGDDCIKLAQTLTEKAFPSLLPGIFGAIQSIGSDNPVELLDGIYSFAVSKVSNFEASLFAFSILQLLRGDQFVFPQ